ncbi:unnamed protein product [Dicrocoelium dendriticum]|nr:unnamed protein product [Dicrocoelium dendriticum]
MRPYETFGCRRMIQYVVQDHPIRPVILVVPERYELRRAPWAASTLNDSPSGFHFSNVKPEEILLHLTSDPYLEPSVLLVNVSPFTFLHCLFVPQPSRLFNQRLRKTAIRSAVECFLLSDDLHLCMGFNSLLAHASVNHLHFHIWQSPEPLFAMTGSVQPKLNISDYQELVDHPVPNFVAQLNNLSDLDEFINILWRLVDACHSEDIAHNLVMVRAVRTDATLRAVLWPRRSVYEVKAVGSDSNASTLSVAVAELSGMFVVKTDEMAQRMVPAEISAVLQAERVTDDVLQRLTNRLLSVTS